MNILLFGRGPSRDDLKKVPNIYTISCNENYPNANLIFAIDDPIIDKLLANKFKGLEHQTIFTNYRLFERYNYSKRIMLIDEDRLFGGQGLSTGIIAIGAALKWDFNKIFLSGFEFTKGGGTLIKLHKVINSKKDFSKIYRIANNKIDGLPINQITFEEFKYESMEYNVLF
ncbi:uncharacterized protein METZ01_LOCUS68312 [marine metagenome]|uniref:Uncharacterized protein n=1 Tax=marine metagenome TaxID=408172 RepID=A0A381TIU2_9ZZZZ